MTNKTYVPFESDQFKALQKENEELKSAVVCMTDLLKAHREFFRSEGYYDDAAQCSELISKPNNRDAVNAMIADAFDFFGNHVMDDVDHPWWGTDKAPIFDHADKIRNGEV